MARSIRNKMYLVDLAHAHEQLFNNLKCSPMSKEQKQYLENCIQDFELTADEASEFSAKNKINGIYEVPITIKLVEFYDDVYQKALVAGYERIAANANKYREIWEESLCNWADEEDKVTQYPELENFKRTDSCCTIL